MTGKLDSEARNNLVKYRMQRAFETLAEAEYSSKGDYYNTAINRLYYACFYAANALLISREIVCETHKGVRTMLSLHFIKNGILSEEHGKTFGNLFQNRQAGDYEDFVYCDEELYNSLRPRAEEFIKAIKNLIEN